MAFRDILPYSLQDYIAYGDYMNAEADINRLQGKNQNLAAYREALQQAQQAKFTAGEEYLAAINAQRAKAGQEPFTGWPEEAMGGRRVLPAVDRMGYPLTPQEEAMYAQASPRRVVQLTPAETAASQPAVRPSVVDTNYSGSGADFGAEEPAQAAPRRVVQLTPEELSAFNAQAAPSRVVELTPQEQAAIKAGAAQKQAQAPQYPEEQWELTRRSLQDRISKASQLTYSAIQQNPDQSQLLTNMLKDKVERFKDQLKPFEETANYKKAHDFAYSDDFIKKSELIDVLEQEINNAEKYTDPQQKSRYLLANAVKVVNNIISADAVTGTELMYKFPELLSSPEYAALMGKGEFNSTTFRSKLATQEGSVGLLKSIGNAFSTNPDSAIRKMKDIHDSVAEAHNKTTQKRIIKPTSPRVAASWGIQPIKTFAEMEKEESQTRGEPTPSASSSPKVISYELKDGRLMRVQN